MTGAKEKVLLRKLEKFAGEALKALPAEVKRKAKSGKPDIFLLGDAEMRRIKKKYLPRNKGPANVLSFAEPEGWPEPEKGPRRLGEIYLNTDITGGKTENLVPLLIHGILHILGYDHKGKSDTIKMENLEKKVLKKIKT